MATLTAPSAPVVRESVRPRSLQDLIRVCERAAAGELDARANAGVGDLEVQALARAINQLVEITDQFLRAASTALEGFGQGQFEGAGLGQGFRGAFRNCAELVQQSGHKLREQAEHVQYVATVAAETATNVGAVAAACEELTSTSGAISQQAGDSAKMAERAVTAVHQASLAVPKLTEATRQVHSVTKLINDIAGQTNLLALNATIEAARAGEAGKGFAVVAAEVKDLSRNTAKATDRISSQVETMQATVNEVTQHMAAIEEAIKLVSTRTGAISSSVSEQVKATAEIARSISDVSKNAGLISKQVGGNPKR